MSAPAKGPTRQQLRDEARRLGLPHSGSRAELEARIAAAKGNGEAPPDGQPAEAPESIQVNGVIQVLVKRELDEGTGQEHTTVQVLREGDIRISELPTLMWHALGQACDLAGVQRPG